MMMLIFDLLNDCYLCLDFVMIMVLFDCGILRLRFWICCYACLGFVRLVFVFEFGVFSLRFRWFGLFD